LFVVVIVQVRAADRAEKVLALKARRLQGGAAAGGGSSTAVHAGRTRLRALQQQLAAARAALEARTDECRAAQVIHEPYHHHS